MDKIKSIPCEICMTELNCYDHKPYILPCGHTICEIAIKNLFKDSEIQCPKDKQIFKFNLKEDIKPNYFLLSILEKTKEVRFNIQMQEEISTQFHLMMQEVTPGFANWSKNYKKLKDKVTQANNEVIDLKEQINTIFDKCIEFNKKILEVVKINYLSMHIIKKKIDQAKIEIDKNRQPDLSILRNYKSYLVVNPDPDLWKKIRVFTKKDFPSDLGFKAPEVIFKKQIEVFNQKLENQLEDIEKIHLKTQKKHKQYENFITKIQKLNDQFGLQNPGAQTKELQCSQSLLAIFQHLADNEQNALAQSCLGYCFYHGIGVKQKVEKSVQLLEEAARKGERRACWNLGILKSCGEGVELDQGQALLYFQKAAMSNYSRGIHNLGYAYLMGEGVIQNKNKGFELFKKAADLDLPVAMNNIGGCFHNGNGVKKDLKQALYWYQRAADRGFNEALRHIGMIYGTGGESVKKNPELAKQYFKLACENGVNCQEELLSLEDESEV